MMSVGAGTPLLRVRALRKHFSLSGGFLHRRTRTIRAVDDVSFDIASGETLSLVGESGCGKSTTGRLIARLLGVTSGEISFEGRDVSTVANRELRSFRRDVQMIFQDPYSSLNPRQTIGQIIEAPFAIQGIKPPGGVDAAVRDLMARVGLNPEHASRYPSEFSGGQRQRIGIARALALKPKLLICDEPVSALDVSVQAQVVNLLQDLQRDLGLSYLFIAHDLSVVRHISHRVAVMYLGTIVEIADVDALYSTPAHPYAKALLSSVPLPDPDAMSTRRRIVLKGELPSPANPPSGCPFHTRCPSAQARCSKEKPELHIRAAGHSVACHFPNSPAL